ncbi:MAG: transporter substrate-binding domain-containing protein [Hyphomicrobiales bacterium]|nr:transporter substrate-binding domain-containing protein [Hyphomicrobiales bacterium]
MAPSPARCVRDRASLALFLVLGIALAGLGLVVSAPNTPALAEEEKPLVLLTEAAHPPYAYLNDKDEMVGFEIELLNAICARIKRSCIFKHREFDRLVPALLAGKGDAIVSSLDITDERREKFTLSEPYFRMPALFVARKDEVPKELTPEALANLSIGALRDSPFASLAETRFPNSPLSTYATQIEANLDLAADRVDVVIGDEMSLRDWLKTAPEASCCVVAGRVDDPDRIAGEGFAVVLRKDEDALKQKFDAALRGLRADGTYLTIARKYFDFDPL